MGIVVLIGLVNAFGGSMTLLGPKIQEDLGFSTDDLQWLGTSFYIPLVSLERCEAFCRRIRSDVAVLFRAVSTS